MIEEKIGDKYLLNFLAGDQQNAEAIMEAGGGCVVPGIVASDYDHIGDAVDKVAELKRASDVISVGLGDGGNPHNWNKALQISKKSSAGHLNQPYPYASYSKGALEQEGSMQLINGLVIPSGQRGYVRLPFSDKLYNTRTTIEMASIIGIDSIKVMPIRGMEHLEEFIDITKLAAEFGIRGVEPAGGIHVGNIRSLCQAVSSVDIEFVMPHIFGSVMEVHPYTLPYKVEEIMSQLEG